MASRSQWAVKHGSNVHTFRTLREAREYAQALNAACGYDFTIISKVQRRDPVNRMERHLTSLFTPAR